MTSETKKALIGTVAIIALILLAGWLTAPEEETAVEESDNQCEFVIKTSELPAHISEPTAGEYHYQLVASSDGYVTIYKCQ